MIAEVFGPGGKGKLNHGGSGSMILTARTWVCRDDDAGQGKLRSRQEEVSPTSPVGSKKKPTVA